MYKLKHSRDGLLGLYEDIEDAWSAMRWWFKQNTYEPRYYRQWYKDDAWHTLVVDYGSHVDFFYIEYHEEIK